MRGERGEGRGCREEDKEMLRKRKRNKRGIEKRHTSIRRNRSDTGGEDLYSVARLVGLKSRTIEHVSIVCCGHIGRGITSACLK